MTGELPTQQHYLPRFLMRGFSTLGKNRERYTFAYTPEKTYPTNLKGLGGERFFHTRPNENSVEIDLGKFESKLAPFHWQLMNGDFDDVHEKHRAAELLAHSSLRSKLLRFEMTVFMDEFLDFLLSLFSETSNTKKLVERYVDENPNALVDKLRTRLPPGTNTDWIQDILHSNPGILADFIDPAQLTAMNLVLSNAFPDPQEFARNTHLKLLEETLVPDPLIERFSQRPIRLVELRTTSVAIGDSVVFYLDRHGRSVGGLNVDTDNTAICLPVAPHRVLVSSPFHLDHEKIDYLSGAVRASLTFFAYPTSERFLHARTKFIGSLAGNQLRSIARTVFEEYRSQ